MTTVPKLTDSQAAILRCVTADLGDLVVLTKSGMFDDNGRDITALGRAALAAYDTEQRRAIRVEAMRECITDADFIAACANDASNETRANAALDVAEEIRRRIAREASDG